MVKKRKPRIDDKVTEIREKNAEKRKTTGAQKTKQCYKTHSGHRLTVKEAKFIDEYIATGNGRQSILEAGYQTKAPGQYAGELVKKPHIREEIDYRLEQMKEASIADATEILQYFTSVMRGEIKDQFDMEAPLGERTKAAQELAKRQIDIATRVAGNQSVAEVKITLNWDGMDDAEVGE